MALIFELFFARFYGICPGHDVMYSNDSSVYIFYNLVIISLAYKFVQKHCVLLMRNMHNIIF